MRNSVVWGEMTVRGGFGVGWTDGTSGEGRFGGEALLSPTGRARELMKESEQPINRLRGNGLCSAATRA